jgi:hypothetical protein
MSAYAEIFRKLQPEFPPHQIEAWVRSEHGTLDHMDAATLEVEAAIAAQCIRQAGPEQAEALAASLGLGGAE